jgi:hypothetical protein
VPTPLPELDLLHRFEAQLDPAHPTRGPVVVEILGYGEISAVLRFPALPGRVFKRMAGYASDAERERHADVTRRYCAALETRGLKVAPTLCHPVDSPEGKTLYLAQPAYDAERVGSEVLRRCDDAEARRLLRAVLSCIEDVFAPGGAVELGLDAQISNWVWEPEGLVYLDVGTPFLRQDGCEQMDFAILTRSLPRAAAWYLRRFEMEALVDRYYAPRHVLRDLVANFVKEGRADLVPRALDEIGSWAAEPGRRLRVEPPSQRSVERYYAADARTWTRVLALRRLSRFVRTRMLRRRYDHILPGRIERRRAAVRPSPRSRARREAPPRAGAPPRA